jgi:glycosyltransferase involved in cell wall biosynthesis
MSDDAMLLDEFQPIMADLGKQMDNECSVLSGHMDELSDIISETKTEYNVTEENVKELDDIIKNVNIIPTMRPDLPFEEIYVIGYPSRLGGADTELDHQIRIWQKLGLEVHLIHTGVIDKNLQEMRMGERGCVIHRPEAYADCRGKVVISYCNDKFLKNIELIRSYAKTVLWVNCMTWLFNDEKEAHRKGCIDWFLYQTDHAREKVQDELKQINPNYSWARVRPYFHKGSFKFDNERKNDKFRFGRVSRADPGKFAKYTWWIYETMVAPVLKEGVILGINDNVRNKIGVQPGWIKCYDAGELSVISAYKKMDCFISANDTYENLPRVAFEAMASGSLLIVDDRGGWKEQIQHGKTGWLCGSDREFAYYSSRAAFEVAERKQMVQNAYDWLNDNWGEAQAEKEWLDFFGKIK